MILMLNARDDLATEPSKHFVSLLASYKANPMAEVSSGIENAFKVYMTRSPNEGHALNMGLILGVLVAHISLTWEGQKFIRDMVDATFNEKLRRQNELQARSTPANLNAQQTGPSVDVYKGVNDWLEKYNKGGINGTGDQPS
jgi:hypothetical protein